MQQLQAGDLWGQLRTRFANAFVRSAATAPAEVPALEPARRLALALSGGGGKGAAHIGVFEVLEELNIQPDLVVGTSAGGAVALMYGAGLSPDQIEQVFRDMALRRIAVADPSRMGLIGQRKREHYFTQLLGDRTFDDLRFDCAVVTVDLVTGEEVVIDDGPLVPALLATTAIPALLPPVAIGERVLVDGGVRNNLPVDVAARLSGGRVIAVDLTGDGDAFAISTELPDNPLARLALAPRQFMIANRSLALLIAEATQLRLAQYPPALLIRPDVTAIEILDMERPDLARTAGVAATRAAASSLLDLWVWRARTPGGLLALPNPVAPVPPPPVPQPPAPALLALRTSLSQLRSSIPLLNNVIPDIKDEEPPESPS